MTFDLHLHLVYPVCTCSMHYHAVQELFPSTGTEKEMELVHYYGELKVGLDFNPLSTVS